MVALRRWLIVALALTAIGFAAAYVTGPAQPGTSDVLWTPQGVVSVRPGSAAARAGLRAGQRIALANGAERRVVRAAVPGSTFSVRRDDGRTFTVAFGPPEPEPIDEASIAFVLLASAFALVIVGRAGEDAQACRLAMILVAAAFALVPSVAGVRLQTVLELMLMIAIVAATASLIRFATSFVATPQPLRRAAIPFAVTMGGAYAAAYLAVIVVSMTGAPPIRMLITAQMMLWPAFCAYGVVALVVTTARARGEDRRRLGWVVATTLAAIGPVCLGELAFGLDPRFRPFEQSSQYALFLLPFGFAYAILRHRVVDVGFAINRATVFAVTTGVLVGLFGLAEWGAERLLASTTHAESLAAELGIAVALIYAVRMMHERAEGVVERLLFAARHRRIASIAGIAADVDDVASEEEIGRFAVRRLREENGIAAALYRERDGRLALLAGAPEHPPLLSLDDPAVVALRARRGIVHGLPSDLPFPHAYPLLVHGRVIGALACAAPDGGAFAPDEDAALARLAAAVAVALEEFGGRSLREQNLRLGAEVEILRGVLRDLGRSTVEA